MGSPASAPETDIFPSDFDFWRVFPETVDGKSEWNVFQAIHMPDDFTPHVDPLPFDNKISPPAALYRGANEYLVVHAGITDSRWSFDGEYARQGRLVHKVAAFALFTHEVPGRQECEPSVLPVSREPQGPGDNFTNVTFEYALRYMPKTIEHWLAIAKKAGRSAAQQLIESSVGIVQLPDGATAMPAAFLSTLNTG